MELKVRQGAGGIELSSVVVMYEHVPFTREELLGPLSQRERLLLSSIGDALKRLEPLASMEGASVDVQSACFGLLVAWKDVVGHSWVDVGW